MATSFNTLILGAALLGTSVNATPTLDFDATVNQCIIDMTPECFDPLLAEFSKQVAAMTDARNSDGYAPIPAAILLKAGMPKRAEKMTRKISDPDKRKEMLGYIGNAYAYAGQIEEARRILGEIEAPQNRAELIVAIADYELIDADVDPTVKQLVDLMDPEFVDLTFSEIARTLIERGQLQKAGRIAEFIFDPSLHAHVMAFLSREFAVSGDVARAITHLKLIRDPDFKVLPWGEVGIALHEQGYEIEAKQLFDEATAMAIGLPPEDPAKEGHLHTIANYLISGDHVDDALSIAAHVTKPEVRANLFYRLGVHHSDKGEVKPALEFFDTAVSAATSGGNPYQQYGTLREIAINLAKIGEVDAALSVARKIADANPQGSTVKSVGDTVLHKGDIARAEAIYASIGHLDLRAVSLIEFSRFLVSEGDAEKAMSILEALETTLLSTSLNPDSSMEDKYLRGSSISSLSRAYVDQGDLISGLRVAMTIEATDQRLWTVIPVYSHAVEAKDDALSDKIEEILFTELQAHPNPGNVLSLLNFIATHPANLEHIETHKKFAGLLDDDQSKSLLFSAIFENLTVNENYILANEVYGLIPDQSIREVALVEFLKRKIEHILMAK